MGLRTKFNLVILAAFAVGFVVAALVLHRVFNDNAREQVLQNARLILPIVVLVLLFGGGGGYYYGPCRDTERRGRTLRGEPVLHWCRAYQRMNGASSGTEAPAWNGISRGVKSLEGRDVGTSPAYT